MITKKLGGKSYRWSGGSWMDEQGNSHMLEVPPTLPSKVYVGGKFASVADLGIGEEGYTLVLDNDELVQPGTNLVLWINKYDPQIPQVQELQKKMGMEPIILQFGGGQRFKGDVLRRLVEFYQAPILLAVVSDEDMAYLKSFYQGKLIKARMGFDGQSPSHLEFLEVASYELKAWG